MRLRKPKGSKQEQGSTTATLYDQRARCQILKPLDDLEPEAAEELFDELEITAKIYVGSVAAANKLPARKKRKRIILAAKRTVDRLESMLTGGTVDDAKSRLSCFVELEKLIDSLLGKPIGGGPEKDPVRKWFLLELTHMYRDYTGRQITRKHLTQFKGKFFRFIRACLDPLEEAVGSKNNEALGQELLRSIGSHL